MAVIGPDQAPLEAVSRPPTAPTPLIIGRRTRCKRAPFVVPVLPALTFLIAASAAAASTIPCADPVAGWALRWIAAMMSCPLAEGATDLRRPARPATYGADADVPQNPLVTRSRRSSTAPHPGANTPTHDPRFEYTARLPSLSDAPTART